MISGPPTVAALAHARPQAAAGDQRRLDDLGVARRRLLGGQRVERGRVAEHSRGLVVGARVVLALGQVHAGLAAVGGVDLGHERGRHLHVAHAALVDGRAEAGQVADHAASDGHDQVAALRAALGERAQHVLGAVDRLVLLARHDHDPLVALHALQPRDVLVGDHEAAAAQRREEPGRDQPAARRRPGSRPTRRRAQTRRVPGGASASARTNGSARRRASRSAGGTTASDTDS